MKIGIRSALGIGIVFPLFLLANPVFGQGSAQPGAKSNPAKKPVVRKVGTVPNDISPDAAEVVWLYHHGSTRLDLLHYVNASHADFKLSVDDVNYLKDVGISTDVVFAMIRPPESRENVDRLKSRYPKWYSTRLVASNGGRPQHALENHEFIQTQDIESDVQNAESEAEARRVRIYPHYFGPQSDPHYGFTHDPEREPDLAPAPNIDSNRAVTPRDQQ